MLGFALSPTLNRSLSRRIISILSARDGLFFSTGPADVIIILSEQNISYEILQG